MPNKTKEVISSASNKSKIFFKITNHSIRQFYYHHTIDSIFSI